MFKNLVGLATAVCLAGSVHAGTLDLTDDTYTSVTYVTFPASPPQTGPVTAFQETVDGVAFDFSGNQFRQMGAWGNGLFAAGAHGLQFGGGGGNPSTFTFSVSEAVTLTHFVGHGGPNGNISPIFDIVGTGVSSLGNVFDSNGFLGTQTPLSKAFVGGGLSLASGAIYTLSVQNSGSNTSGFFTGLTFEKVDTSPIPLPAGLPLLLGGFAALGLVRRSRKRG